MKTVLVAGLALILSIVLVPGAIAADDGAALFKEKCAKCHGEDGSGDTTMGKKMDLRPLGSAEVQKSTDAQLTDMIANGGPDEKKMHQFKSKGLTDAQIKTLIAHIRTMKK